MSTLRELLAHDISHGDMAQSDTEETGADRIGALARADPLGAALWRVTGNMDAGSFLDAKRYLVALLAKKRTWPWPAHEAVAQLVLEEWLACQCIECGGRKFVVDPDTGTRSTCRACSGTGRGRHSDDARMVRLSVTAAGYSKMVAAFDDAHALLNAADRRVERQIAYQLERRNPLKQKK